MLVDAVKEKNRMTKCCSDLRIIGLIKKSNVSRVDQISDLIATEHPLPPKNKKLTILFYSKNSKYTLVPIKMMGSTLTKHFYQS